MSVLCRYLPVQHNINTEEIKNKDRGEWKDEEVSDVLDTSASVQAVLVGKYVTKQFLSKFCNVIVTQMMLLLL